MSFAYLLCADSEMSADDLGRLTSGLPHPFRPSLRRFELSLCTDEPAVLRTCPRFDHACCGGFIATSYRVSRLRFAATALAALLDEDRLGPRANFGVGDPLPHLRRCLRAAHADCAIVAVATSGTIRRTLARYPAPPAWHQTVAGLRHGTLIVLELAHPPPAACRAPTPPVLDVVITGQYLQMPRPTPIVAAAVPVA